MSNQKPHIEYAPICDFVPGYAFYDGIGGKLAEQLVDLVEWLLGLRR